MNKLCLPIFLVCLLVSCRGFSAYKINGTCKKVGSDQPNLVGDLNSEEYYHFEIVDRKAKLLSSLERCSKGVETKALQVSQRAADDRLTLNESELQWWSQSVENPIRLKSENCQVLKNPSSQLALVILKTKLSEKRKRNAAGNKLLTFIKTDKKAMSAQVLSQFISGKLQGDMTRDVEIDFLCDIDDDKYVEIILKDSGYGGFDFWILKFPFDFSSLSRTFVKGTHGD